MNSLIYLFFLSVRIISSAPNEIVLKVENLEYRLEENGDFSIIYGERNFPFFKSGEPDLPCVLIKTAIPPFKEPVVKFSTLEKEIIELKNPLIPYPFSENDGLTHKFIPDKEIYSSLRFPIKEYEILGISFQRGLKVLQILYFPFIYHPLSSSLTFIKSGIFKITLKDKSEKVKFLHKKDPFETVQKKTIMNVENTYPFHIPDFPNPYLPYFENKPFWIKIPIKQDGLYAITYSHIKNLGIEPKDYNIENFSLFSFMAERFPYERDIASLFPLPDTVAFKVIDRGEKNVFDEEDTLLFYGIGGKKRKSDSVSLFQYYENPFTDINVYLLVMEGGSFKSFDSLSVHPSGNQDIIKSSTIAFYRHEKNLTNLAKKGFRWLGETFYRAKIPTLSFDIPFFLNNLSSSNGKLILSVVVIKKDAGGIKAKYSINGIDTFSVYYPMDISNKAYIHTFPLTGISPDNIFKTTLGNNSDPNDTTDYMLIDYFDIWYERDLVLEGGILHIYDTLENRLLYKIPTTRRGYLLDVTDEKKPIILTDADLHSDTLYFEIQGKRPMHIFYTSQPKYVYGMELISGVKPLMDTTNQADYIIITHTDFKPIVESYAGYRKSKLYLGDSLIQGAVIRVLTTKEIFDQFGFGIPDFVSIRNFLAYTFYFWREPKPIYVLLAGGGTFDYKNYSGTATNFVPPYEVGYAIDTEEGSTYTYDDFFVQFDSVYYDMPDMVIGRIPARSKQELSQYFQKLKEYEKKERNSPWRGRILGVSDDNWGEDGTHEGINFMTVMLQTLLSIPKSLFRQGLYTVEDPPGEGQTRPLSKVRFFKEMEKGYFSIFFYAHGNPEQLTHEKIIVMPQDVPRFNAGFKNPFVFFGSCKTNNFDRLTKAIGEHFMIHPQAGIATLGSSTFTGLYADAYFIQNIFSRLSDFKIHTLGEVVYAVKTDKSFNLLGDPTLIFSFPEPKIDLSYQKTILDTVKRSSFVSFQDTFRTAEDFLYIDVYVGEKIEKIRSQPPWNNDYFDVYRPGNSIFRGTSKFFNDSIYEVSFFVPRHIISRDTFSNIFIYSPEPIYGKSGIFDSIVIYGDTLIQDTKGPEVTIRYKGEEIKDSATVLPESELEFIMQDEHGIRIYRDDDVRLEIKKGNTLEFSTNLTSYFINDMDNPQRGRIFYKLPILSEENVFYTLSFTCYDNQYRGTTKSILFKIQREKPLALENVLPFPNPSNGKVAISFNLNKRANVNLKIFTIRGRMIYETVEKPYNEGFNKIKWEGYDLDGDIPANGVYLFKIEARAASGGEKKYFIGKIVILR